MKAVAERMAESEIAAAMLPAIPVGPDLVGASSVALEVHPSQTVIHLEAANEEQLLSFRGAEYYLPKSIVTAPLPTLTFRHLEKVTMAAFAGRRDKVQSGLKRAVASAIDTASLVKIACMAHSEGLHASAITALVKALHCAKKDQQLRDLALLVANRLGYHLNV
ncbi:MAG: hypothetical protein HY692_01990 [Cyanobacteria bacterium NC_groundwater_1444_Ag_S-0.65um_54_12]|nr:hypothetical protein [Cyanobacteria bacterium NC_groundwater_1444_Ag_S-0.65um_54_12]